MADDGSWLAPNCGDRSQDLGHPETMPPVWSVSTPGRPVALTELDGFLGDHLLVLCEAEEGIGERARSVTSPIGRRNIRSRARTGSWTFRSPGARGGLEAELPTGLSGTVPPDRMPRRPRQDITHVVRTDGDDCVRDCCR
jgi:hypothetical protein